MTHGGFGRAQLRAGDETYLDSSETPTGAAAVAETVYANAVLTVAPSPDWPAGWTRTVEGYISKDSSYKDGWSTSPAATVSDWTALLWPTAATATNPLNTQVYSINGNNGAPAFITYSFPTDIVNGMPWVKPSAVVNGVQDVTLQALQSAVQFSAAEQKIVRDFFAMISAATGLVFLEVKAATGDMPFIHYDFNLRNPVTAGGYAAAPGLGGTGLDASDVFMDLSPIDTAFGAKGVLLHEIGHALGLKHPHEGPNRLNQLLDNAHNTVMTYENRAGATDTLLPMDKQALQHLYGSVAPTGYVWNATSETLTQNGRDGVDDKLFGTSANDIMSGGTGNDTLVGKDGNNTLLGGAGDDTLTSGVGNLVMDGGIGNDTLSFVAGAGKSFSVDGGAGIDTLKVILDDGSPDVLTLGQVLGVEKIETVAFSRTKPITITTNDATGTIYGGDGNDILKAAAGSFNLVGGKGDDVIYGNNNQRLLRNADGTVALATDAQGNLIKDEQGNHIQVVAYLGGGEGNDTLYASTRGGNLFGDSGADKFYANLGQSYMAAGTLGNGSASDGAQDIFYFSNPQFSTSAPGDTDNIGEFRAGEDKLDFTGMNLSGYEITYLAAQNFTVITGEQNGVKFRLTVNGQVTTADILGDENFKTDRTLTGGNGNDELIGGSGADTFYGGLGKDTMVAGFQDGSRDTFVYKTAAESVAGNADIIWDFEAGTKPDGSPKDLIDLSAFRLTGFQIVSLGAHAIVKGFGPNDEAFEIYVGSPITAANIKLNAQTAVFMDRTAPVAGGTLHGADLNDILRGQGGNDTLNGWTGDDVLVGGGGDDVLRGGIGNDRINGGAGQDTLDGNAGRDTFVFKSPSDSTAQAPDRWGNPFDAAEDFLEFWFDVNDPVRASDGTTVITGHGAGNEGFRLVFTNYSGTITRANYVAKNTILDGHVVGATVYQDANGNGVLDPGEESRITDEAGNYNGFTGTGTIRAFGGVNSDTGLPNLLELAAPVGSHVLSTITTLIDAMIDAGFDQADAEGTLSNLLGIDLSLDLVNLDTYTAAQEGDALALTAQKLVAIIANVAVIAAAHAPDPAAAVAAAMQAITDLLVLSVDGDDLDLTNAATLTQIYTQAGLGAAAGAAADAAAISNAAIVSAGDVAGISAAQKRGALTGTGLDNALFGGAEDDLFDLSAGGNDHAVGGSGNDAFYFGAAFDAADVLDGGSGPDVLILQGDYAAGLTFGSGTASNIHNIESISLFSASVISHGHSGFGNFSYNLKTLDSNVGINGDLRVNGSGLLAGEDFTFDGSAETDGRFKIYGGKGIDSLTGGANADIFVFAHDARFGPNDEVRGGGGYDVVYLRGDYSLDFTGPGFGAGTFDSVESIGLLSYADRSFAGGGDGDFDYSIIWNDSLLPAGQTITINGSRLGENETMSFIGTAELDGAFRLFGGSGIDDLRGGAGDDLIYGGAGGDGLSGGDGNDTFRYQAITDSLASGDRDSIHDFTLGDLIDLSRIDADAHADGNQAFTFIEGAFTGRPGELRATQLGESAIWTVEADVDGNGFADLAIVVTTADGHLLSAGDFVL
ncbi:MAG TPA: matrixin family metalloprotease [Allosphingosinicella sp.]|jgi:Ca2+-binding RTX toxin-like protein|nr:matrixin family metalloprotease [Allosphingosinicella sp.]